MDKYIVLQSGFVTRVSGGLAKPRTAMFDIADALVQRDRLTPNNPNLFNPNVTSLYREMVKTPQLLADVGYLERVLSEASRSFGTSNFAEWVGFQNDQPTIGNIHRNFLLDIFRFLETGTRQIHVTQWIPLLDSAPRSVRMKVVLSDYFKEYGIQKAGGLPRGLSDILIRWVQQDQGLYDLVSSLMVIFGERQGTNQPMLG